MSMVADKSPAASAVALAPVRAALAPVIEPITAVALAPVRAALAPAIKLIFRAVAWAAHEARQGRPAPGCGRCLLEVLSKLAAVPPGVGPQSRVGDLPSSGSAPPLQRRAIGVSTLTAAPPPAPAQTHMYAREAAGLPPRAGSNLDDEGIKGTKPAHNGGSAPGHRPRAPPKNHAGLTGEPSRGRVLEAPPCGVAAVRAAGLRSPRPVVVPRRRAHP